MQTSFDLGLLRAGLMSEQQTVHISQSFAGNGPTSATIVCFVTCPDDLVLEMQYVIDRAV